MAKKFICPKCQGKIGFSVVEFWPNLSYTVSSSGEVLEEDSGGQREYEVSCLACHQIIDDETAGQIIELVASN